MKATPSPAAIEPQEARIAPILPLTLLETVRSYDRPGEYLENEDVVTSLPRRFGLSEVVSMQIRRYADALRRGERIPLGEVHDLVRLVLRRPDAEMVLRETGRRLARRQFERGSRAGRAAVRVLPQAVALFAARRAARRLLRPLSTTASVKLVRAPLVTRIENALTVAADSTGTACVLYSAALEELATLYTGSEQRVRHSFCSALGDSFCEWTLVAR